MNDASRSHWSPTRGSSRRQLAADIALAGVLLVLSLGFFTATGWDGTYYSSGSPSPSNLGPTSGAGTPQWFLVLCTTLIIVPISLRRTRPTLAVAACYSGALLHLVSGIALIMPADLVTLIALYSVTVYGSRRSYLIAAGGAIAGSILVAILLTVPTNTSILATILIAGITLVCFFAAWSFGMVRRTRRAQLAALAWRAERLEQERDEQIVLATAAERTRIAREMHDIVAHSLSVLIAQADGGRYIASQDPAAAARALETIGEVGRAALSDMRRLLGVLRPDASTTGDPSAQVGLDTLARIGSSTPGVLENGLASGLPNTADKPGSQAVGYDPHGAADSHTRSGSPADAPGRGAPGRGAPGSGAPGGVASDGAAPGGVATATPARTPQPSVETLDTLINGVRQAGLRVSYGVTGQPRPLPPGIGLVIYRVCQEALTNILKHAGPEPTASIMLNWRPSSITIEILDDGRGAAADHDGLGQGIIGMMERTAMFNGDLSAGPRAGGGYQVSCTIPLPTKDPS